MQQQEVNYNGVLGGYGNLSNIDISYSTKFLQELRAMLPSFQTGCVLDCGAGIGRVTK